MHPPADLPLSPASSTSSPSCAAAAGSPAAPSAVPSGAGWWAVCLCAGWCGTCTSYRALFDALALEHPAMRFEWVDIEDESELAGDLDVETFPTLLIADGTQARFLGPLLPQAPVLARLISSLQAGGASTARQATHPLAQGVFERVRAARTDRTA